MLKKHAMVALCGVTILSCGSERSAGEQGPTPVSRLGKPFAADGILVRTGDQVQFCEETYMSRPPRCGDDGLTVTGAKLGDRKPSGAASGTIWYTDVRLVGERSGDTVVADAVADSKSSEGADAPDS